MDIGRSITYVFQDPRWLVKVLVGGLLLFIPIFGWLVVAGYWLRIVRQVAGGAELPLPEWNDFGNDFVRGAKALVVGVVWSLPLWVLEGIAAAAGGIGSNSSSLSPFVGLSFGASCLLFLLSLALAFMQPLYISRLAVTDSIGSALDFTAIFFEARRIPTSLLLALVMTYALVFAASFGFLACVIGIVFTMFLAYAMLAHLYGQVRREAEGSAPLVPTALP